MKTIIRAKHNPISMQELRSLLLMAEAEAELEEVDKSLSLPSTTEIIAQDDNIRGSTPAPTLITNAKSDVNSMMPTSSVASSIGYNVHSMSNSSPSQSAASPGPQPLYMTNASSPCTPTFVDYSQTSYLGFPQPSANTCLTQPTDFFAHNNGGMLQRFGAHMPQMQTNSYLLQLVAPSTFTPCHASNDYAVTPSISISNGAPHSMPNSGYGMNNGTGNENFNEDAWFKIVVTIMSLSTTIHSSKGSFSTMIPTMACHLSKVFTHCQPILPTQLQGTLKTR
ncbi:uncharacterized protein LOC121050589 [Rosa chinensis]|uniref:uncharacterized protein LOC121050589 n=1 Tax=Rosa chinensis TaxID=74649 RepID=UPI001AD8DCFA|nr:uncharacterized protein LOC121050589 [Rosa chinensis]